MTALNGFALAVGWVVIAVLFGAFLCLAASRLARAPQAPRHAKHAEPLQPDPELLHRAWGWDL